LFECLLEEGVNGVCFARGEAELTKGTGRLRRALARL
jgi:hypothetical protein